MEADDLLNINLDELKKKVAEKLGMSLAQLEEEIEKLRAESRGWVGERTALLLLLERWGVNDRDIFEDIVMGNSITSISELNENIKNASLIARIMRISPELTTRNNRPYVKVIIDDGTGKALLLLFGDALKRFKELNFNIGDVILLRRVRVQRRFGEYLNIVAGDNSRIDRPDEEKYKNVINTLPEPPIVLSVYELLDTEAILDEGDEVNIRGVIDSLSEMRTFTRKDDSEGKVVNIVLVDENVPNQSVRLVAWDDVAEYVNKELNVGEIVEVYGGRVKFGYNLHGERRLEIHSSRLGVIRKIGVRWVRISELDKNLESKVVIYGIITNEPLLREFERDGEMFDYMTFRVSDGTGTVRVVIWDPNVRDIADVVSVGKKIRIYGRVRENNGRFEIHVSRIAKNIDVEPKDFPDSIDEKEISVFERDSGDLNGEVLEDFSNLTNRNFVSLLGMIEYMDIPENERMPWQLIITDKAGKRVKILGWDRDLAEKIRSIGIGGKIKITNLRISRDDMTGEVAVKTTLKTGLEAISSKMEFENKEEEFIDAKSLLNKRKVSRSSGLDNLDLMADETEVIASIILINEQGKNRFCSICGAPIISEENICENGHIDKGEELRYANVIVEDGKKSYEALITEKALNKIVNIDKEDSLLKDLERIIGLDFKMVVKPKVRNDGKVYLIIREIQELDYRSIIENKLREIEQRLK